MRGAVTAYPNMCDVAVVGAGPAGAWTAHELARRGARVLMFDPSHPREKPCGGGVTGRALALVGGAVDVSLLPSVAIDRATFRDDSGRTVDVALRQDTARDGARRREPHRIRREHPRRGAQGGRDARRRSRAERVARRRPVSPRDVRRSVPRRPARRAPTAQTAWCGADSPAPFTRSQLSIATGFFAHGVTSDRDRHRTCRAIRPATSGPFRGRIILPSVSARRRISASSRRHASRKNRPLDR